jgi:hypothetical protein
MTRDPAASLSAQSVLGLLDPEELGELKSRFGESEEEPVEIETLLPSRLLVEVAKLRLPFIRMMNDIASLLTLLEAGVRGNIRFVALSDRAAELQLDFGPQVRGAIATALNSKLLADHASLIEQRFSQLDRSLRMLLQFVRRTPVSHVDEIGALLQARAAMSLNPAEAYRDEWMAEHLHTHTEYEFSPADLAELRTLADGLGQLEAFVRKVLAGNPPVESVAGRLKPGIARLNKALHQKLGPDTGTPPRTRSGRSRHARNFTLARNALSDLREAVAAASDYINSTGSLYEFLNLQVWSQRWRVYELWILARMATVLLNFGAAVRDGGRIVNGMWQLKFTKDSAPALAFDLEGHTVELYYQLYQERGDTGDMPDLALRMADGPFVAVVDPKHGYSYSRRDLNDVCERYADAFRPFLSCVCNYFPVRPTEELRQSPAAFVLYDLNPDSRTALERFDTEVARSVESAYAALGVALRRAPGVVVLFDVSASAASVRAELLDAFRSELARTVPSPRSDSRALLFSTGIDGEDTLGRLDSEEILTGHYRAGTALPAALRSAMERVRAMSPPVALWLFTDGQDSTGVDALADELRDTGCSLMIVEAGASSLQALAERAGGRHVRV